MNPLEQKPMRLKKAAMVFFCPLCRTERQLRYRSRLSPAQYGQIFCTGALFFALSFSSWGVRAFIWFFLVWLVVEAAHKLLYRRQLPCPHCGFDATWYRRDVRLARKKVLQFWEARTQESDISSDDVSPSGLKPQKTSQVLRSSP